MVVMHCDLVAEASSSIEDTVSFLSLTEEDFEYFA